MALSLHEKLRIKKGMKILAINAPPDFKEILMPLPGGIEISSSLKNYDQIHWFVKNKQEMEEELPRVLNRLRPDIICWIYYPKGSSSIQTDLTRDKGWESLLKLDYLQWISLISFNEVWSSFGMRLKTISDKKKEATPKERVIFQYVDPKTKAVRLPAELATAFKKNKKAQSFFDELSFTNKKEFIEWIVTAKREETKKERIAGTIERLNKAWKNPENI
ncbi:MAG: YdeI family protein [Chitinophagales bacterium]